MEMTFFERLKSICPDVKQNEPMSRHTTFKIGGPADYFLTPKSNEELVDVLKLCREENISCIVTGNGSNMLVSDKGIDGVVISISEGFSNISVEGTDIEAGAGVILSRLSNRALEAELSGLEFASGIPGTLGGAVYMNAGAYGEEMKGIVKSVTYIDEAGKIQKASAEELNFGYRRSMFTGRNCVILSCRLGLSHGDKEEIKNKIVELTARRTSKQPLNMPSAGSVFKRPEGHFAGTLIEQAGLKGYSIGGAQVSQKHAGFIVNKGNASAADVLELIEYIQKKVEDKFSVCLEPEIKLIGRG